MLEKKTYVVTSGQNFIKHKPFWTVSLNVQNETFFKHAFHLLQGIQNFRTKSFRDISGESAGLAYLWQW